MEVKKGEFFIVPRPTKDEGCEIELFGTALVDFNLDPLWNEWYTLSKADPSIGFFGIWLKTKNIIQELPYKAF